MLRTILVGLDGSAFSATAVDLAIQWTKQSDGMVVGLGVIDEPGIRRPEMMPIGAAAYKEHANDTRLARARSLVEQLLEQFSLRCTSAGVASKVLEETGEPCDGILRQAQRYDLIMLGRQTHFHFATQDEPCETLTKVLKQTPRPVVAVPAKVEPGAAVVIAYDGSLQAARALQAFQGLQLVASDDVHVVTVGADYVEASRHTDRALDFLGFHGVRGVAHVVASAQSPASVLLEKLRQLNARLVVMGAYGRSAVREFFLGSVTRTLLAESPVPLFLYH